MYRSVTETFEAVSVATVAASAAAEPDRLFTLTPSRWLELDKECATFLHTALRHASGDQCKSVVIGNIEQMESAAKNVKVSVAELSRYTIGYNLHNAHSSLVYRKTRNKKNEKEQKNNEHNKLEKDLSESMTFQASSLLSS